MSTTLEMRETAVFAPPSKIDLFSGIPPLELVEALPLAGAEEDPIKQVIVIRTDLNMRKGKMAAQASHASMSFITRRLQEAARGVYTVPLNYEEEVWLAHSFTKICVGIGSEEELLALHEAASAEGLTSHLVIDNGTTEFHGVKTPTCLALGPHRASTLKPYTGELKLL